VPWPRTPVFDAGKGGSNPVGDAGPEIRNGLGAFLCAARYKPGFGGASLVVAVVPLRLHLKRTHVAHRAAWPLFAALVRE
jgi:hypothetical protein